MLFSKHFLGIWLLLSYAAYAQQDQSAEIKYSVIVPTNSTLFRSVGVLVDQVLYPLKPHKDFPILYSGKAPVAQSGYQYTKLYNLDYTMLNEPFMRQPVSQNTPQEFFSRSWNTRPEFQMPQIYSPLSTVNRIPSELHKDNQIPTIHIIGDAAQVEEMHKNYTEDISLQTTMSYFTQNDAILFPNTEISLSGRTSRNLPKLSYNLKLKKDLYGYKRLKLRSLGTDPSYIRERLAYDMVKSVGLISSEFSFVRLVINDQEMGLFGLIDTFRGNWLSNVFAGGSSSYERGYLYEGVRHSVESEALGLRSDLSYVDNTTAYGAGQYKIKAKSQKKKKNEWKPLQQLTNFIATAPIDTPDVVEEWNKHLDTESFLRAMALEVVLGYGDGYLTMADNFYLYQHPGTGQFVYIPSDMDLTFGSGFFNKDDMSSGNYSRIPAINTRPLWVQMMRIPVFKERFEWLIQDINIKLIDPKISFARLKYVVDMIQEDVEWDQTLPRVGINILAELIQVIITHESKLASHAHLPDNADLLTYIDLGIRLHGNVPFWTAVDGPTFHPSLPGVKEWLEVINRNIILFFSSQK